MTEQFEKWVESNNDAVCEQLDSIEAIRQAEDEEVHAWLRAFVREVERRRGKYAAIYYTGEAFLATVRDFGLDETCFPIGLEKERT